MSLTILQWLSQILTALTGVWALMSDTTRTDAEGRRHLTPSGYAKVVLFIVGFSVFLVTDRENARRSAKETAARDEQLRIQQGQLAFLQRLLLFQHDVSALELSWTLRSSDYSRIDAAVRHTLDSLKVSQTDTVRAFAEYLPTALRNGDVSAGIRGDGTPTVRIILNRPLGLYNREFVGRTPQWALFETAMRAVGGGRVELRHGDGRTLVDPFGRHWPPEVRVHAGSIALTVLEPGVRFADIDSADVSFEGEDQTVATLPPTMRLRSLDPRLAMDTTIALRWRRRVLWWYQTSEEDSVSVGVTTSQPIALRASIRLSAATAPVAAVPSK